MFPTRTIPSGLVVLAMCLAPAACSHEEAASPLIDSEPVPRLTLVAELRVGSLDEPDYAFSRVRRLTVDREGRIYVTDFPHPGVRVYDRDGQFVRQIGGRGRGPGEFQSSIASLGITGDTLWVVEIGSARITKFSLDGRVIGTARVDAVLAPIGDGRWGIMTPHTMENDGSFVGVMSGTRVSFGAPPVSDTASVPRLRFSGVFEPGEVVVDTIGWDLQRPPTPIGTVTAGVQRQEFGLPVPPADWMSISVSDGLWIIEQPVVASANASTFRVLRTTLAGDTVVSRSFAFRPEEYGGALLDSLAARSARLPFGLYTTTAGPEVPDDWRDIQVAVREAMAFPQFQAPVQGLRLGNDGRLWLQRSDRGEASVPWLVIDPDGAIVGEVGVPRGTRVVWSSGNLVWAVEQDGYEVPWLVRYAVQCCSGGEL